MENVGRPRGPSRLKLPPVDGAWIRFEWPAELKAIAARRCSGLFRHNLETIPLSKIMESAYLQGVEDGIGALAAPAEREEGEG